MTEAINEINSNILELNADLEGVSNKMYSIGASKPTSGYTVYGDSYLHRSPFGQVDISLNINAVIIQSTWHIVGYVAEGYRPAKHKELSGYILPDNGTLIPISCYVYDTGAIMVYNTLEAGNYHIHVFGSYFIWSIL